jgi:MFS family permease
LGAVVTQPDRVQIWASQLAANDFPPVCAMSGQPAETWRKFKFATPPTWAYALLVLVCLGGIGIILYAVVITVVAQKASGFLPLTRHSSRTVALAIWVPAGLLIGWIVLWLLAAAVGFPSSDSTVLTIAAVMFWVGLLLLIAGLVGRLLVMRMIVPRAKVMEPQPGQLDKVVELQNVSPVFVGAVHQVHAARMAQTAGSN